VEQPVRLVQPDRPELRVPLELPARPARPVRLARRERPQRRSPNTTEGAITMSDHKVEDLTGKAKQAAGDLLGDEGLKREGDMDRASAATKKTIDSAADTIKDALAPEKP
jgi:uncharacterized protein YjbJ (UPF0337 family)